MRDLQKPVSKVSRFFRKPLEVYRCQTDGGIIPQHSCPTDGRGNVFRHRCPSECHSGHYMKQPVLLTKMEYLKIQLGLIRE